MRKPIIGIPADRRAIGPHRYHCVGEKYIEPVSQIAGAVPVLLPALGEQHLSDWLETVDAVLLTGSASNVEPQRYAGPVAEPGTWHDPHRDATTLPMIPAAIAAGLPVLGLCRGFQEMNVAFGGTLWQKLHEVPGFMDHREDKHLPVEQQYAPRHEVILEPGGLLAEFAGTERLMVNSLHAQGVQTLGRGLVVEARAPDGVIEGFRVAAAPAFALAVQWHPEWKAIDYPFSRALFTAFGEAARTRALRRAS